MDDPFQQIVAVLAVAAVVGFVATRLRQPLIVAFIAVGVAVGPSGLEWVEDTEPLELFAEIGIAVLLFLVGLKLDLKLVRTTGPVALITGLGQVAFTSIVGFGLAMLLGMEATTALYVAVALTFSSTIIIVKLLSDKREIDELHGRIALGFLIVQDIVVVLVMIALTTTSGSSDDALPMQIALVIARGVALVAGLAAIMRWVLPWLLHRVARSQELLLITMVAWAVAVAALGDYLGFSVEVGAFLAGFALASTRFREAIGASLTPLRDFLLLFFFLELGSQLDFSGIGDQVPQAVLLSAFVLIGNPIIVMVIMGVMGYRKRVGFLSGLAVAQISEFSLIFVALGLDLGHIDQDTASLVTLVGVITIAASTYLILYSHPIYDRLEPLLGIFERSNPTKEDEGSDEGPVDVIVYGYGRYGQNLVWDLADAGLHTLVVDWDPVSTGDDPDHAHLELIFGDAEDATFPSSLPLRRARLVVSTIPRVETNRALLAALRQWGYEGAVALTAHTHAEREALEAVEDDDVIVLCPFSDAARVGAANLVEHLTQDGASPASNQR